MPGPRAVTSGEHGYLQSGRQAALFFALIDAPPAIFTARVNQDFGGAYDRIAQITYDGATGDYTDILADMTLLIGSAAGLSDRGVARIRKAASSTILYIGEISEIAIQDNDYLTVLEGYEPWAKHARIDAKVIKMDYDIAYSDQHSAPDPVPVLGSDVILERLLLGDATVTAHFDASDSWVIGGAALSYAWMFPGALSYTGETTDSPSATYDTPGRYLAYCAVSTASKSFTGVRLVHVLGDGYMPLEAILLEDPSGDVESGGWMASLTVFGDVSGVRDRAKVYIFSRDYLDLAQLQQGPDTDRGNLWPVGWIVGETIQMGSDQQATFEIQSEAAFLDRSGALAAGYEDTRFAENGGGAPNTWKEFQDLTIPKALWSLLHWRTTLTRMTDVRIPTDNTDKTSQAPAPPGSIWNQIRALAEDTILARSGIDRLGRLWIQVDPQLTPVDERDSIPVVMELEKGDVADLPVIQRRLMGEVSRMEVAGNYYASGNVTTFGALAPGNAPGRFGDEDPVEGLVVHSQQHTIDQAALLYGYKNNPYPEIPLRIQQINRFIDVFPVRQYCTIDVAEADNSRGLSWTSKRIIPRQMSLHNEPMSGGVSLECVFEAESQPGNAVKYIFPGSEGGPPPGGEVEPPPPPPPPPPPEPIEGSDTDVVCATGAEVRTTGDFDQASPTWSDKTGAIGSTIFDFCLVDNDTAFAITSAAIYKTGDLSAATPTWTAVWIAANDWPAEYTGTPQLMRIVVTTGYVYVLAYSGDGSTAAAYLLRSHNDGTTWTIHTVESGITDAYEDYYIDEFTSSGGAFPAGTDNLLWWTTRPRYDNAGDGSVNPRSIGMWSDVAPVPTGKSWTYNPRLVPDNASDTYIHGWENAPGVVVTEGAAPPLKRFAFNNSCSVAQRNEILAYLAATYGTINVDYDVTPSTTTGRSMPYASTRVNFGFRLSKSGYSAEGSPTLATVYIIWYYPHLNTPKALAAHGGVVYVGLSDKIVVSRDAGVTWESYIDDHGANDIIIPGYANPQDRCIIYWSTDGGLYWTYGNSNGEVVKGASLLAEASPKNVPYRIVSDPDVGWPLFALSYYTGSQSRLYKLSPGTAGIIVSQELLVDEIPGGTGLRMYKSISGRRLFYLDNEDIQYSDGDDGATWSQKKGGWSGYSGPVRIEALTP